MGLDDPVLNRRYCLKRGIIGLCGWVFGWVSRCAWVRALYTNRWYFISKKIIALAYKQSYKEHSLICKLFSINSLQRTSDVFKNQPYMILSGYKIWLVIILRQVVIAVTIKRGWLARRLLCNVRLDTSHSSRIQITLSAINLLQDDGRTIRINSIWYSSRLGMMSGLNGIVYLDLFRQLKIPCVGQIVSILLHLISYQILPSIARFKEDSDKIILLFVGDFTQLDARR